LQAKLSYWEKDEGPKDPDTNRKKQRRWRNTRDRLIRSGQIKLFKGTVEVPGKIGGESERRVITFVKLLVAEKPDSKVGVLHRPAPSQLHTGIWSFSFTQLCSLTCQWNTDGHIRHSCEASSSQGFHQPCPWQKVVLMKRLPVAHTSVHLMSA